MTIKDLAAKTGYGVATVSRVLNGQPNVSEKAPGNVDPGRQQAQVQKRFSQYLHTLRAVAQSAKRMALRSVEILIRNIENETTACHEAAPYTICLKESTSRPV